VYIVPYYVDEEGAAVKSVASCLCHTWSDQLPSPVWWIRTLNIKVSKRTYIHYNQNYREQTCFFFKQLILFIVINNFLYFQNV